MKNHSDKTIFVPIQYQEHENEEFNSLTEAVSWCNENLNVTCEGEWEEFFKEYAVTQWEPGEHLSEGTDHHFEYDCTTGRLVT